MTGLRAGLWVALAGFAVLTGEVLWEFGYLGFFGWAFHNLATTLLFVDMAVALTLLASVVVLHAQARGIAPWPYLLLTLVFGVAGPLLYFARHYDDGMAVAAPIEGRS
jgi:hypothetical protein